MRNDGANKHRAITGDWFRARRKRDSGLRSSISRLVRPPGPPPKLIFDQLEARLLMSADPVLVEGQAIPREGYGRLLRDRSVHRNRRRHSSCAAWG